MPFQREVQLYSTFERVLARLAAYGRVEIIEKLLGSLNESLDVKKLKQSLWSQIPKGDVEQFLNSLKVLMAWMRDDSFVFPLNGKVLVANLSTEQVVLVCDFVVECFPSQVDDLLLTAVEFGHLLPTRLLQILDQSELFSKFSKEDSERFLPVARQLIGQFSAEVKVYDASIDCCLTLPALFARFYLEDTGNADNWSELFVSAMSAVISYPNSAVLNATFRAFCRLKGAQVGVAKNFMKFGAFPLTVDPETNTFPALNAVLADNEDLALFLVEEMSIPLRMLNLQERQSGVSILQAALHKGMIDLLRKLMAVEGFSLVTLKAWHYQAAQQARLFDIPFSPEVLDFYYWPRQYSLSLAAYSATELIERPVAFFSSSLLYAQGFWLMKALGVREVWIRLPDSHIPAVMSRDDLHCLVTINELYTPRDLSLRFLKYQ